jgi:Cu2+-exporting ATPase
MAATPPTSCAHCGLPVPATRAATDSLTPSFCCFGCRFANELTRHGPDVAGPGAAASPIFFRLGLGIFLTMNIMVFTWFFHSRELFSPDEPFNPLASVLAYLLMFLCSGVVAALGTPLLIDAIQSFRPLRGRADANLLICIGVGAAFTLSAIHTVRGRGSIYFDTAALILVLVTLGQYLDSTAKRRATAAASDLFAGLGTTAWVRRGGQTIEVAAGDVGLGEHVRVRPGDATPVDGMVIEGASHLDEASLTGESRPRAVAPGDRVLAGSINLDGLIWVEAKRVGGDRLIEQVQRLLHEARQQQPPIQRLADRVAAVFVPAVLLLAVLVFAWHGWRGEAARGLFDALSVLLISCPCALGLAAPLASWSALARAARHGVVIDSAVTLDRAAGVRLLFFDKTGTLTDPRLAVQTIQTSPGVTEDQALQWAASIEQAGTHPIAAAITRLAAERSVVTTPVRDARVLAGVGIEAAFDDGVYRLGSWRLLPDAADRTPEQTEALRVYLLRGAQVLATFDLAEQLRADAPAAVGQLQRDGIEVAMLTGDQPGPAERIARTLGIGVEHSLLPHDKLARLQAARARASRRVAMVGDGINDGPVLAAADVGFAVAGGADLARQAGHVHLVADALDRVPMTLDIARDCRRRIILNLTWAFSYNGVGIALAAAGLLTPIFAATAMFASSLVIIRVASGRGAHRDRSHRSGDNTTVTS